MMPSYYLKTTGLGSFETVEDEGQFSSGESTYSNPVNELILRLEEVYQRNNSGHKPEKRVRRLGPADRFAIVVSLSSLVILLFVFVSRISKAIRKRVNRVSRDNPFGFVRVNDTRKGRKGLLAVPLSADDTPAKGDPGKKESEDGEDLPPPRIPGGPGDSGGGDGPEVDEQQHAQNAAFLASRAKWNRTSRGHLGESPPARLLAISPALLKEERRLRELEEMLFSMELDRYPNPGPEEFVLGVLSRVLDIQHLGRHSDA